VDIAHRTGPVDRPRFEAALRRAYAFAGTPAPERVVWVESPVLVRQAAAAAGLILTLDEDADVRTSALNATVPQRDAAPARRRPPTSERVLRRAALDLRSRGPGSHEIHTALGWRLGRRVRAVVRDHSEIHPLGYVWPPPEDTPADVVDLSHWGADNPLVRRVAEATAGIARTIDRAARGDAHAGTRMADVVCRHLGADAAVGEEEQPLERAVAAIVGAPGERRGARPLDRSARARVSAILRDLSLGPEPGQFGAVSPEVTFVSFLRRICGSTLGPEDDARADLCEELVEAGCFWLPHRRFVIACERPVELRSWIRPGATREELHHESGPAARWPDGWAVHAIDGVPVPERVVIGPDALTVDETLGEPNAEVRRVMCERRGYARLLGEAGGTLVDDDPEWGRLWRVDLRVPPDEAIGDRDPVLLVECRNATAEPDGSFRRYVLRVPPTTRTAHEALAWTFDVPPDEYRIARAT